MSVSTAGIDCIELSKLFEKAPAAPAAPAAPSEITKDLSVLSPVSSSFIVTVVSKPTLLVVIWSMPTPVAPAGPCSPEAVEDAFSKTSCAA